MGLLDSLIYTLLGPSGSDREDFRDLYATPTYCFRCGRRITRVYVFGGRPYGSVCFDSVYANSRIPTYAARETKENISSSNSPSDRRKHNCPECNKIMILSEREVINGDYDCPYCGSNGNRIGHQSHSERPQKTVKYDMSSYNARKFTCPDCTKIMVLTAEEHKRQCYHCPYCASHGKIRRESK